MIGDRCILFILMFPLGLFSQLCGQENFLMINGNTSVVMREFGKDLEEQVTPACSFNIALSLMGYDVGVLEDENNPIFDFQEGYDDISELWKRTQNPKTWMSYSCLWYSKKVALKMGLETMQRYLALFEYGNQDMSGGLAEPGPKNPAWVSSSLKISPKGQVDFIQKMVLGHLNISEYALHMTRLLLLKEELEEGWKLFGKTGLGNLLKANGEKIKVHWFVGWVQKGPAFFPFAYQLRSEEIDMVQTVPRVKQLLAEVIYDKKSCNGLCGKCLERKRSECNR